MIRLPDVQWEYINLGKLIHWMIHDILTVLSGPELTLGLPFPGLTNAAPPSQKSRKWSDALDTMAVGCDSAPRQPMRVHQRWQMNALDESWYLDHPQWTRTYLLETLSRFDKCSSPSQKSGEWSDTLDAMAVGRDLASRWPIRVHQRWQMNTLDESWYFDHPQWTRTHLWATLFRFDKCSSHFLLQRSDWIGCNLPLGMTSGSNRMVMEAARWPQAKQGAILAP
jgi:hypothetical protein